LWTARQWSAFLHGAVTVGADIDWMAGQPAGPAPARGSVQSGFNEVAIRALGVVCVARPHRSLQIQDIDKVNHLIGELNSLKALIAHAENADPTECELFIKLPGDSSMRMSSEGAALDPLPRFSGSSRCDERFACMTASDVEPDPHPPERTHGRNRWYERPERERCRRGLSEKRRVPSFDLS
jgi:hypothetical protein